MQVRWEKLAGDTDRFAVKIAFTVDPDDGLGVDPDVSVSWGGFQLWVKGENLCAHHEGGEQEDSVRWYLLPLLEWFVSRWNFLMHEERLPIGSSAATAWEALRETRFPPPAIEREAEPASAWESAWHRWWQRHAIRAAREGGLFPDVVMRRAGNEIEVSWGSSRIQGMPGHFSFDLAGPGCARFRPAEVMEPLYEVVSGAGEYLESRAPTSERLRRLNRQIRALRPRHGYTAPASPDTGASDT